MRRISIVIVLGVLVIPGAVVPARADFSVAYTAYVESRPTVAWDPDLSQLAVAHLEEWGTGTGPVILRFFDAWGNALGSVQPFGTSWAISRPHVVYHHAWREYLVFTVVPMADHDEFLVRRIDALQKTAIGDPVALFTTVPWRHLHDGSYYPGASSVRLTVNTTLTQYLVTAQLTGNPAEPGVHSLWGQVLGADLSTVRSAFPFAPSCTPHSHALDHAPIGTDPAGGRFLLAVGCNGSVDVQLLDAWGNTVVADLPLDLGKPDGEAGYPDVAYGVVDNSHQFLVVWSDGNNCRPGTTSCAGDPDLQHTGIWGTFLDPFRTVYDPPNPDNVPFPISGIPRHWAAYQIYMPRVAYNERAGTFFAAWVEHPSNDPLNDLEPTKCTHVRGSWVDSLLHPNPDDVVLSDVTCTCPPPPAGPAFCTSAEDPRWPDVAPAGSWSAAVVWQSNYPPAPADQDLWGDLYGYPAPANDSRLSPQEIPSWGGDVDCSLQGAGPDVAPTCGNSGSEPDVWYSFTAPYAGQLHVSTCGTHDLHGVDTGVDSVLSMHDGAGNQLAGACNDDWPSGPLPTACSATDLAAPRDSALAQGLAGGQTAWIRVSRYGNTRGGPCLLHASFSADAAGRVAQDAIFPGWPLTMEKSGADVTLDWQGSCLSSDLDYEVYEGVLGSFGSHVPRLCSTGGGWSATLTPGSGNRYYLVVPRNAGVEGSYGLDGGGAERPASASACLPQSIGACD